MRLGRKYGALAREARARGIILGDEDFTLTAFLEYLSQVLIK
jgi:hypothetical protein